MRPLIRPGFEVECPAGPGKSALLVYLPQRMAAVYGPRIAMIEAGGSFSLLAQHFQPQGLPIAVRGEGQGRAPHSNHAAVRIGFPFCAGSC